MARKRARDRSTVPVVRDVVSTVLALLREEEDAA
jgi:hypothetical protein